MVKSLRFSCCPNSTAGLAGRCFVGVVCRGHLVDGASRSLVGLGWSQLCSIGWWPL